MWLVIATMWALAERRKARRCAARSSEQGRRIREYEAREASAGADAMPHRELVARGTARHWRASIDPMSSVVRSRVHDRDDRPVDVDAAVSELLLELPEGTECVVSVGWRSSEPRGEGPPGPDIMDFWCFCPDDSVAGGVYRHAVHHEMYDEANAAVASGFQAACVGALKLDCPYPHGDDLRQCWMVGLDIGSNYR